MGDPLPPDPYLALGVACDATPAAIKTQYRKLVLKYHPDKVQDEAQKAIAADEFHKIQTAYEIIGDDSRRQRYDAQRRLNELKKEMMERSGGPTARQSAPNVSAQPPPPPRAAEPGSRPVDLSSQKFEEGRPSFANSPEFFDSTPRATARKDPEGERSSKRAAPRTDREKARHAQQRDSKETERSSRREKSRRTDRDIRRDRERKQPVYSSFEEDDAGNGSTSDEFERARERRRRNREEDEARRAREAYHDQARRQHEEAARGLYADERTRKLFSQADDAREYIERSSGRDSRRRGESARRPSPVRAAPSREKIEYIMRTEGRPPIMIRRGSGRPKVPEADPIPQVRRSSTRDREVVDEPRDFKVPPLVSSKSSPADIHLPFERQRAHSTQMAGNYETPIPTISRSQTMPVGQKEPRADPPRRRDSNTPAKSSGLRAEPQNAYPTPEHSPERTVRRYRYGQEYADDAEFPTPDGYRTGAGAHDTSGGGGPAFREPVYNRSPERSTRERVVTASAAAPTAQPSSTYPSVGRPSQPSRINTTTFLQGEPTRASPKNYAPDEPVYSSTAKPSYSRAPPAVSRENSGRSPLLYGEVPTTASSGVHPSAKHSSRPTSHNSKFPSAVPAAGPSSADVQYQPAFRREDVKIQTGYSSSAPRNSSSRHASSRPEYYRENSGNAVRVR